jgi:hypothetical protein
MARSIIDLGRAIVELGGLYQSNKPRDEAKYHNQLLTGEVDPRSGLDVLRAMGGYFARGRRFETQLEQDDTPRLLSQRSSAELLDQIVSARSVLADVLVALPPDKPIKLTVAALRAEMESLWSVYGTEKQREVVRDLAIDLQRVPDLTDNIAANGDAKALEESPLGDRIDGGKHHPRSTLEMFRFIYRYYAARA